MPKQPPAQGCFHIKGEVTHHTKQCLQGHLRHLGRHPIRVVTQRRNVASRCVARRGVDSIAGGHSMRVVDHLRVHAMGLLRVRGMRAACCAVRIQRDHLTVLRVLTPLVAVAWLKP